MFSKLLGYFVAAFESFVRPVVVVLDADQGHHVINTYEKHFSHIAQSRIDTRCVIAQPHNTMPRKLKKMVRPGFKLISVHEFAVRKKETSDKYIGIMLQKEILAGKREFAVISGDMDFVDIFAMLIKMNNTVRLSFELIVPRNSNVRTLTRNVPSGIKITRK